MDILCGAAAPTPTRLKNLSPSDTWQVEKVTTNALKILHLCGRTDVDVVQGQAAPLLRPPKYCPQIHGESGLDGPHWPMQTKGPVEGKAVNVMFQKLWECYVSHPSTPVNEDVYHLSE